MRATFFAVGFVITAIAVVSTRTAAAAADTAYLSMAEANPYSSACPATLHFTGHIDGVPGSSVTYNAGSYAAGAWVYTNPQTQVIPASGSLPIASTLTVDASRAGFQSYGVGISSPSGSDSDTHGKVYLTVTCVAGGNKGGIYSTTTTINSQKDRMYVFAGPIPPPTNVHATTNPQECAAHLPTGALLLAQVCAEILGQGGAAMVFSWQGSADHPDVDGFHVYNVAGHVYNPSLTSSAGGTDTLILKKGPLYPVCFVIRAYKGGSESNDSQQVCLAGGTSTRTASLNTTNVRSHNSWHENDAAAAGIPYAAALNHSIDVGHWYWYKEYAIRDSVFAEYRRAGLLFDVQSLHANFIFKAVLHLHMTDSSNQPDPGASTFPTASCITEVGLGTNAWWNRDDQIDGDFSEAESPAGFWDVTVDVTREVRDMIKGKPNLGFILRGSGEDLGAFTKSKCESTYAVPPHLDVTYN